MYQYTSPSGTVGGMHMEAAAKNDMNLDNVCSRSSYVTSFEQFLSQTDDLKALHYWLSEFSSSSCLKSPDDIINALQRSIADIDHMINDQLNAIIHNKRFQQLESSWRGLWYLVVQAEGTKNIKLKLLDANWSEVSRDIGKALDFDQTQLFQKIYSEEYGTPGGEPYGIIIGDYEVSHKPSATHKYDDITTLEGLAQIAAAAFSPFIVSASPEFFGLDDLSTLGQPLNLHNIFSQQEYTKWQSFRNKTDSRFIGITLPHILMRLPYRKKPGTYKGIFFYEQSSTEGREHYCWGSSAYAFGAIMIREFANVGWFGHIRGAPRNEVGGGLLTTLPCDIFETDSDAIAHKPVTDIIISDVKERELSDLGLIPLCQCYDTPLAAFYSNQSVHRPLRQATREGDVNARLSAMLQHVLCASRIAHYIKVIIRDRIGSFMTAEDTEEY